MRITVIDVDADDTATAMSAIAAALGRSNGHTPPMSDVTSRAMSGPPAQLELAAAPVKPQPISKELMKAWQFLVAHDRDNGITPGEVAAGLHLKHATAIWRMNRLLEKGMAYRVKRGHYRAGEAA